MVVNMNMRGESEGNINQYLADTISQVFGQVYTVDVSGSTNRELFASEHQPLIRKPRTARLQLFRQPCPSGECKGDHL